MSIIVYYSFIEHYCWLWTSKCLLGRHYFSYQFRLYTYILLMAIAKKKSQTLNALAIICLYVFDKRPKTKALTLSFSTYGLLAWVFQSRDLNNKVNPLHEQTVRTTSVNQSSSFQKFKKNNSAWTYPQNIPTEIGNKKLLRSMYSKQYWNTANTIHIQRQWKIT